MPKDDKIFLGRSLELQNFNYLDYFQYEEVGEIWSYLAELNDKEEFPRESIKKAFGPTRKFWLIYNLPEAAYVMTILSPTRVS